jgi:hypothetical protein
MEGSYDPDMQVSSELPVVGESIPPVLLARESEFAGTHFVEDEEFPSDAPAGYDWMLQPASRRTSPVVLGLLAVMVLFSLIAVSTFFFHKQPKQPTSELTPFSASSR